MSKTAKTLATIIAILFTSFIITAISSTKPTNRPGGLGGIIVLGLLAGLAWIWRKDKSQIKNNIGFNDYYKALDISSTASLEEIEFAYRKLSKFNNSNQKVNDEIQEAYIILKDSILKPRYDEEYFRFYLLTNPKNQYNNIKPKDFSYNDESLIAFIEKNRKNLCKKKNLIKQSLIQMNLKLFQY